MRFVCPLIWGENMIKKSAIDKHDKQGMTTVTESCLIDVVVVSKFTFDL